VPQVTVVVLTRRRETRLAFLLDALAAQTLPPDEFEVIVVRDADDAEQRAEVPARLRARIVVAGQREPLGTKRNLGWKAARGELVAFTDDDCRPSPGWLAELHSAWRAGGGGDMVLQGAVRPDPDETHLLTGLSRSLSVTGPSPWFQTANLALPRALLERLGGFDAGFELMGEDTDLGLRALSAGAEPAFVEGALVHHAVHVANVWTAACASARARGVARVFSRHPGARRAIPFGLFWKRSHATALLALAGVAATARGRRWGLLALLPYVFDNYDRGRPATPRHVAAVAAHLPGRFAVDLAETAATVRGAVEARTPLA
jgi:GT2 family glycosyltransferase